jgi:hypothetical protein
LIDSLAQRFDLHLGYVFTVYMHDTPQVWCATRLYDEGRSDLWRPYGRSEDAGRAQRNPARQLEPAPVKQVP